MFTSLRDYFANLRFAEKRHFDDGDEVRFGFGNNLADPQRQYAAFLPKDGEETILYRWNSFFPKDTKVSEKLSVDESSDLVQEFIRKIKRHEIVPIIYVG